MNRSDSKEIDTASLFDPRVARTKICPLMSSSKKTNCVAVKCVFWRKHELNITQVLKIRLKASLKDNNGKWNGLDAGFPEKDIEKILREKSKWNIKGGCELGITKVKEDAGEFYVATWEKPALKAVGYCSASI